MEIANNNIAPAKYDRLKILSLEEVFEAIKENREFKFNGFICSPLGGRVLTYFLHGTECVWPGCCIKGEYFAVERQVSRKTGKPITQRYHLNIYGKNELGEEIMMTADHKIPKSLGGKNNVLNYQPMCSPHNQEKGNQMILTK